MNIYKAFSAVSNILAIVIIILQKVYCQCCNVDILFVFKSTKEKLQQYTKMVCWVKKKSQSHTTFLEYLYFERRYILI